MNNSKHLKQCAIAVTILLLTIVNGASAKDTVPVGEVGASSDSRFQSNTTANLTDRRIIRRGDRASDAKEANAQATSANATASHHYTRRGDRASDAKEAKTLSQSEVSNDCNVQATSPVASTNRHYTRRGDRAPDAKVAMALGQSEESSD